MGNKNISQGVPEPTIRRLPTYLNLVKQLKEKKMETISAPFIGQTLRVDSTQVVKDLAYTGAIGRPRIGYRIDDLLECLQEFLGYNRKHATFLVGAGSLGTALIKYSGFSDLSMEIVAAFDTDKTKIGNSIKDVQIFDLDKFRDLAERLHIVIGIITTPAAAAQEVADLMVGWGIKAIWNFAPVVLKVPSHIIVQDTHIYANLAVILNKLSNLKEN